MNLQVNVDHAEGPKRSKSELIPHDSGQEGGNTLHDCSNSIPKPKKDCYQAQVQNKADLQKTKSSTDEAG